MPDNYELDLLAKTKINSFFFSKKIEIYYPSGKKFLGTKIEWKKKERERTRTEEARSTTNNREREVIVFPHVFYFLGFRLVPSIRFYKIKDWNFLKNLHKFLMACARFEAFYLIFQVNYKIQLLVANIYWHSEKL